MSRITKNTPIRVGVIGAGMMGQHHLRVYNMLRTVELVAVVDVDFQRAKHTAQMYGCDAYKAIEDLIGKVDAVSIAAPTSAHAEIGLFFLNHGIHCLIEKPLAVTEIECQQLIAAAEKQNVILLVGHIEHFNPAVQKLSQLISENHIVYSIDARRLSNAKRIIDVDVIMDLMVHDIEIVLSMVRQPVLTLSSHAVRMLTEDLGYVSALLTFSGGAVANLTASKVTPSKVRQLEVTTDRGYFSLEYSTQELLFYREMPKELLLSGGQTVERIPVSLAEPLVLEIQNFIQSIQKGVALGVNGQQALESLRLVWQIQEQIQSPLSDVSLSSKNIVSLLTN